MSTATDTRVCTKCDLDLPTDRFYRGFTWCKKCHGEYRDDFDRRHPGKRAERLRRCALQRKFGITLEDYDRMLSEQDGDCAICLKPEHRKRSGKLLRLSVDHCHDTGKVRGLLCHDCNTGLGKFRDDPELTRRATEYLER